MKAEEVYAEMIREMFQLAKRKVGIARRAIYPSAVSFRRPRMGREICLSSEVRRDSGAQRGQIDIVPFSFAHEPRRCRSGQGCGRSSCRLLCSRRHPLFCLCPGRPPLNAAQAIMGAAYESFANYNFNPWYS
jgi:hypothetical protein